MAHKPIPKNPKIVLFANSIIGLQIAHYLKKQNENIVALIIHPSSNEILADSIKNEVKPSYCFDATEMYDQKVLHTLQSLKPDIGICAWFGYILKKEIINLFPCGIINTHNSYLPYNRGKYPQSWAIATQSPYGVSLHYIDKGIDTGDILIRKRIPISIIDNGATLYNKGIDTVIKIFKRHWPAIKTNKIQRVKQRLNYATHHYARQIDSLDKIELNKKYKAIDLINQIRARNFNNKTYAYFIYEGKKIYIKMALSK